MDPFSKSELSNIPTAWDDKDLGDFTYHKEKREGISFVGKFFIFSILLFFIAGGFLFYTFYNSEATFSENKISIVSTGPGSVTSGEDEEFSITITNNNPAPISGAYIETMYDSGENSAGNKNIVSSKIDIGDLLANSSVTKTISVKLFGAEGTIKNIKPVLHYKVPNSKAEFNKDSNELNIILKSSPISLNVKSLKEMYKDKEESFTILVKNNTENEMKDIIVTARTPNSFRYSSSSELTINSNPSWKIKSLPAKSEKQIIFSGRLSGDIGEVAKFTFLAGVSSTTDINNSTSSLSNFDNFNNGIENVYSKLEKTLYISGPYIDIYISSDSTNNSDTVSPGELINIEFTYKNSSAFPVDNVVFKAKLIGGGLNMDASQAIYGYKDYENNIAVWNSTTMPELSRVAPQYEGKFKLQLRAVNSIARDNAIRIILYASGERNLEDGVSNYQDISVDRAWTVRDN